jgi:hypothetical protein
MRDHEKAMASLGDTEIFRAKDAPAGSSLGASDHTTTGPPSAFVWRNQWGIRANESREEASKSVVTGSEEAGNIFENRPGWLNFIYGLHILHE